MQQLLDAVKQVKQTIQTHKTELSKNEALTRHSLIDVILNALGWEVHNPAKVIPEYTKNMGGGSADYVLIGNDAKPIVIVEAKKLGSKLLDNEFRQIAKYMLSGSIRYCLFTDGNSWKFFNGFQDGDSFFINELMRFSFENEPENLLLIKLVSLMPVNLWAGSNTFFPTVQEAEPLEQKLIPIKEIIPLSPPITGWTPLSKIVNTTSNPKNLRFPDETIVFTEKKLPKALIEVAEWLIKSQKLQQPPTEDFLGVGRWYLINTSPIHKNETAFKYPYLLCNGWYLETSPNIVEFRRMIIWLIQQAGENPDNYYFQ